MIFGRGAGAEILNRAVDWPLEHGCGLHMPSRPDADLFGKDRDRRGSTTA